MSGTGYYDEQRVPPEHRGQTWELRTNDGVIQSPFPPVHVGNPLTLVPAFFDFQNYSGALARAEHPEYWCDSCGRWLAYQTFKAGGRTCRACLGTYPIEGDKR